MRALKTRFIVLACILSVFAAVRYYAARIAVDGARYADISLLPRVIGKWKAADVPLEPRVRDILETDAVLLREYADGAGGAVGLALVYYPDAGRVALHLPESCLMGHGTRLAGRQPETILARGCRMPVMRLIIERGTGKDIVIYYFQTAGYHTSSYAAFRARLLMDRLTGKRSGCALVRYSVTVGPGGDFERSLALLHDFIISAAGPIDAFLP